MAASFPPSSTFPPDDESSCSIETIDMDGNTVYFPVECDWDEGMDFVYPKFRWSKQYWTCRTINDCYFGRIGKG